MKLKGLSNLFLKGKRKPISLLLSMTMMISVIAPPLATAAEPVPLRNGLRGDYYTVVNNSAQQYPFGEYKATFVDSQINFPNMENILLERAGANDYAGTRWTGKIIPKVTGDYIFSGYSDNGFRLYVGNDNTPIIDWWKNDWDKEQYAPSMHLEAGKEYSFKMDYMELNGGSHVTLNWNSGSGKVPVPADVFYLRDDFRPAIITNVDTSNAVLKEGQISGNIVLSVTDLTETTSLTLVKANGDPVKNLDALEIVSKTATSLTVKAPVSLPIGGYKFVTSDNGITFPSPITFAVTSENVRAEYPRPDWERSDKWMNLNGVWDFKFDPNKVGQTEKWFEKNINDLKIIVPFPWEAPASGVVAPNYLGTAWYQRDLDLDQSWAGKSIILKFGAVDWMSTLYVNGQKVGDQVGGYTPFEYDITNYVTLGQTNKITLMVNDEASYGKQSYTALVGKQGHNAPCGYTHTSGIWQTVIVEGRYSPTQIGYAHVDPQIDTSSAKFNMNIVSPTADAKTLTLKYNFKSTLWDNKANKNNETGSTFSGTTTIQVSAKGDNLSSFVVSIPNQKLWWPEESNLYEGTLELYDGTTLLDKVNTYFGQRKISRAKYGENPYEYVYLNNKPIFLSGLLDQGFWEDGIYTAPSADALKFDIESMRSVGFNLIRKHLKIEDPMQYYWCDRLGMMVWTDMPHATNMNYVDGQNGSGRPVFEKALAEMISRDYNHPSTIAYIPFNETWGIIHNTNTDAWVRSIYTFIKTRDTSGRLAEDMSPCNNDHVQPTDMNTFHMYPGSYNGAKGDVDNRDANTYVGSRNNFNGNGVTGNDTQMGEPWLNSEYGGVGAYSGDHDVSWCFKYQTDVQRLRQKLNGFVYTEPFDVEYECNGILNYDRSWKIFGYNEVAYGGDMGIKNLTQPEYIGVDKDPMVKLAPGGTYTATVGMIRWSDNEIKKPIMKWRLDGTDVYGNKISTDISGQQEITYKPYTYETKQISFSIPAESRFSKFVGTVTVWIEDEAGKTIAKNFINLKVTDDVATKSVDEIGDNSFALRQATAASNTVANGVGAITYNYNVPDDFDVASLKTLRIMAELSSIKIGDTQTSIGEEKPSDVTVSINGHKVSAVFIPDAPRDMRGTLSLNSGSASAGEFGYLVNLNVTDSLIATLKQELGSNKTLTVKYEVAADAAHKNGVKAYNETNGRYAVTPMVILNPIESYIADSNIAINNNSQTIQPALDKNNFSIEADVNVTSGKAVIAAGYEVTIDGANVTVKENGVVIATATASAAVTHIKATFFDQQVRVYVNNNPDFLIDVYGKASAVKTITLSGDNVVFSNFTVIPESYESTTSVASETAVQYVESFNTTAAFSRWTAMGTTTDWGGQDTVGSFEYTKLNDANGYIKINAGAGHKIINNNIMAANLVAEGDFTIDTSRNSRAGNAGFIIRGSEYKTNVDGANGYYIGVGYDGGSGFSNGFIEVGRMSNGWTQLKKVPAPVAKGESVRLKVVAVGPRIMVYLNDNPTPYVDVYDSTYTTGSVALRGFECTGSVDNIVISTAPRYTADFDNKTSATSNYTTAKLDEWSPKGTWTIADGKLNTSGEGYSLVGSEAWTDSDVSVAITPDSSSVSGIALRSALTKKGLSAYVALVDAANSKVIFGKFKDGSFTEIQSVSAAIPTGTETTLRVVAVNNSFKVYYGEKSKLLITAIDNDYINGKSGLVSCAGATAFDNFVSTDKFRLEEKFSDGALAGWTNVKGNWTVQDNIASVAIGTDDKLVDGYATRGDFQLDFDFRLDKGESGVNKYNAGVVFRATDFGPAQDALRGYVLGLNYSIPGWNEPSGLELGDIRYGWRRIETKDAQTPFAQGEWYHLTIRCEGQHIQISVNGEMMIDVMDSAYSYGQIALRNFHAGASYKNLVLKELNDDGDVVTPDFELLADLQDGGIKATFNNNTNAAQNTTLITAVYNAKGVMVHSEMIDVSVGTNTSANHTFAIDMAKYAGCTYKVFAWDTDTMMPICDEISGGFAVAN